MGFGTERNIERFRLGAMWKTYDIVIYIVLNVE